MKRLRRKPEAKSDAGEDLEWQSFRFVARYLPFLFAGLAVVGVGLIVIVSGAPILVLGVLTLGFALYGSQRKETTRIRRVCSHVAILIGAAMAVYSAAYQGEAVLARLQLVWQQTLPGPNKHEAAKREKARQKKRQSEAEDLRIFMEFQRIKEKYVNLPADYPVLLEEAHALAERSKSSPAESSMSSYVLMEYSKIKEEASYYKASYGNLPIYRKIFGADESSKEK